MPESRGARHRVAVDVPASEAVVRAVAATTGEDPATLDPPLYDVVDPDALDALFADRGYESTGSDGRITFTMADCRVVVRSTGRVTATPVAGTGSTPSGTAAASDRSGTRGAGWLLDCEPSATGADR